MSTNGAPLLALEGVSKRFGPVQALEGVDFEVRGGEVVALVGDNGAGKSTLVKSISGIYTPDEGEFFFEGRPVKISGPERCRRAGDRDRLPGPGAVRQPRRRGQPVPRAGGHRLGRQAR